ncbi:RecF/RecN/SMC, N-terminal [Dillenia turbinata]|uniref:RecF/RecN/SMC, N-terminal n=1 Tax=Dillenia turbinata TaxID=194707 RepID=A0AAN8V2S5_9MAGN
MEEDSRVFSETLTRRSGPSAGIIKWIKLENFMCHSSLQIELGEWVNFITGQNGSGKSAILTALCVAFGCRARGTQRASTLKDFIKTGCSYALVQVEIKNEGEDAFKPEIFGDSIILERRITESGSSTVLKDHQGKKVTGRKDDLCELVEHFNIDVENPCVIMSQDKSREFLHSGNDKDKFKFFFKATLLQQVFDLLQSIKNHLVASNALIDELESSIRPILKELEELQVEIRNMEHVEEISQQVQQLKKKLAWSWVYDADKKLLQKSVEIQKLKQKIPACQDEIDKRHNKVEHLQERLAKKKAQIGVMIERTSEVRRMKDELHHSLSEATSLKVHREQEYKRKQNQIQKIKSRVRWLEQQVRDIYEQDARNSQAEESEMERKLKELDNEIDAANFKLSQLKEEETACSESLSIAVDDIQKIDAEVEYKVKKHREICRNITELQQHQTNKVTAFGGERVINLLRAIEQDQHKFRRPPIGPIGAHVNLVNGDTWAPAVENAIGKLLNAFIVTEHKDSLLLRKCAREANYSNLQIIIYEFSRPRLHIPSHLLPQTQHPTTLSLIQSNNPTVGHAERQVLVKDYSVGTKVAFDSRVANLKEVFTLDGYRMFSRGSVQTILPPNKRLRTGRLCSSFDEQIKGLERDASSVQEEVKLAQQKKRIAEEEVQNLQDKVNTAKRRRLSADRELTSKKLALQELKMSYDNLVNSRPASTVDELHQEISKGQDEIQKQGILLEDLKVKLNEAEDKVKDTKSSFESLCDSAKEEINAFEEAEKELVQIEEDLQESELDKMHYEGYMNELLPKIEKEEAEYKKLEDTSKEYHKKAPVICPESEVQDLGGCQGCTPEQLSAQITRLSQRLQRESEKYAESIDELRTRYEKKEHKILRKQKTYQAFRQKLKACQKALDVRLNKFDRNSVLLRRQLTWQFNGHLRKKGISGHIKVDYEAKTLSIEVKMPQDSSGNAVRDTRGLSGGERSFSTLCFALALHEMTEAPFRAMDEFDVFMDAVSRKISLDTLVDFALAQGSQWIFITPHDISGCFGKIQEPKQFYLERCQCWDFDFDSDFDFDMKNFALQWMLIFRET